MADNSKVNIKRIDGLEAALADIYSKIDEAGKTGTAHNVGEVFWSQSSAKQDNPGALPLFTGEYVAVADYGALHNFLLRNSALVTDETTYNTLKNDASKDVPYYLIKDSKIYLPILRHYIKNANTTDGITQSEAGLPNITGTATGFEGRTSATGAFSMNPVGNTGAAEHWVQRSGDNVLTLDASQSSNVYGGSNTVTPAHSTLYPWVSYLETKYDIVTADSYAESDLSNVATIDPSSAVATELGTINTTLSGKQDTISDLNTIRSGASAGATALQSVPVATSSTFGGIKIEWDATNKILNIKTV